MIRSYVGFSPFSLRYPQPVTTREAPALSPKALGGRQTGLRLTGKQGQCINHGNFKGIVIK